MVVVRPRRRTRRKFTLSLAVVGGFTAQALPVIEAIPSMSMSNILDKFLYQFGCYNKSAGAFEFGRVTQYLPLFVGCIIHGVANRIGVNRAIGRAGIPWVRI